MTLSDLDRWEGKTVVDCDGDEVGTVDDVYLDADSNEPEWVLVAGRFVPLTDAVVADTVTVRFEKGHIEDAPEIDPETELAVVDEAALYEHYGLPVETSSSGNLRVSSRSLGPPQAADD